MDLKVNDDAALFKIVSQADSMQLHPMLHFLSPVLRELLQDVFLDQAQTGQTLADIEMLQSLWKELIVDAIHFLRINDHRERAFFKDIHSGQTPANKTTMQTDGAKENALLNVYGIEDLYRYFRQFTQFESTLYGADEYYRDHVLHPLRIWATGLHLLQTFGQHFRLLVASKVEIVDAPCADPSWFVSDVGTIGTRPLLISTAELAAMWTIVALTHDLGYPLEKVERVNDQLERMLSEFGRINFSRSRFNFEAQHDHLVTFLLKVISSALLLGEAEGRPATPAWHTHLRPKYLTKFSKSWEMFDHGLVSSLILLRSLTFFVETDFSIDRYSVLNDEDARQFAIRAEILHAIAAHTAPKVYHLLANTLPFLLVLCDELQEWGRPTMSDLRAGRLLGNATKVSIEEFDISPSHSVIKCLVEYQRRDWGDQKKHAQRVFKAWHERLRPAVDDEKRSIQLTWSIKFAGTPVPWRFDLDPRREVFQRIKTTGPDKEHTSRSVSFDLYD